VACASTVGMTQHCRTNAGRILFKFMHHIKYESSRSSSNYSVHSSTSTVEMTQCYNVIISDQGCS
jgi:hypothetical protein